MNAPRKITLETREWIECPDCEGSGEISSWARWSGEGNGGEPVSHYCESCDGNGGWFEEMEEAA